MEEIEEIKELQFCFKKSANILGSIIKLMEELEKEKNEEKIKKLTDKLENKQGEFMIQMLKINKLNK